MPNYQVQTSGSQYAKQYNFKSTQHAKQAFCDRILGMSYENKDDFSRSSQYFEEMGVLLAKYSNEKCYAIKSFAMSISDFNRWALSKSEYSGKSNREILGEEYFLKSLDEKCGQLFSKLKSHMNDINSISMPGVCCEVENSNYICTDGNLGYNEMMINVIGCSANEGVCDYNGGEHNTFQSDL